jgi:hypothetical protein
LVGTLLSALAFVVGLGLAFVDAQSAAAVASGIGSVVLLATPAVGLLVTAIELRRLQPQAAALAVAMLGVLAVAVVVALIAH